VVEWRYPHRSDRFGDLTMVVAFKHDQDLATLGSYAATPRFKWNWR
jgi:hypothetical protein